ncbi:MULTISPECIES: hypothetical protein [Frankia]|uniref:hypothetical protein n=1 Tax=Frankia TaxID=1854 RepID=UPI0012F7706B|nr:MULTISPECIES: hypothetical protein [Frankia]
MTSARPSTAGWSTWEVEDRALWEIGLDVVSSAPATRWRRRRPRGTDGTASR